jgi:hypothetical protein
MLELPDRMITRQAAAIQAVLLGGCIHWSYRLIEYQTPPNIVNRLYLTRAEVLGEVLPTD